MRLPPLAALLATRLRHSSVMCLKVILLRRNQLTLVSLLVVTLVYISLVITHQNGCQKVSQCSHYYSSSSSSRDSWTAGSSGNAADPAAVSAAEAPWWKATDNSNNSSSAAVRVSRPFFQYLVSLLRNRSFPGARNYSEYHLIQHPDRFRILPSSVQPLRPDFGPVINDVTSFHYPIDIRPCQNITSASASSRRNIGLFLAVISAPGYFDKRQVIRETWLSQLARLNNNNNNNNNKTESAAGDGTAPVVKLVGHGFVVGLTQDGDIQKRIEEESAAHGDILQVNVIDTYADLTRKVAGALNWINSHCSRVDFVLKVDDDVYVNTRNLISIVKSLNASHQSIYGTSADGIVRRDGKFAVSVDDWPWTNYPPYSMGAFLLMPGRVIEPLLAAAQTTPYFPFEDAYIGLCADKARVKMRFSPRALAGFVTNKPQPCYVHNSISWLTQSVSVANMSHNATKEFYHGVTSCKKLIEMPIDPFKTPRKFDFT